MYRNKFEKYGPPMEAFETALNHKIKSRCKKEIKANLGPLQRLLF